MAWSRCCDTRNRKSEITGNTNIDLNRRASPRPYLRGGDAGNSLSPLDRSLDVPGKAKPSKLPFYIARRDGLPLTFAGLWEKWKDGMLSCTILTCEACDGIRDLHTRMPVMLAKEGFEPWLAGENPSLDPCLNEAVTVTPVSPKMNSPKYNEPDCIEPLVA